MLTKERKSSVIHIAGKWTWQQLQNLTPPQGSTAFIVIFYTTQTKTGRGQTPWISVADFTPADYIMAQRWRLEQIAAVVYQKPEYQRRGTTGQ